MKQNVKKWLGCTLALLLVLPILAATPSEEAQNKLEDQIFTLLQQRKYEKVKTTLVNIPVCPESGKVFENQVPAKCTFREFNPDPFKMSDSNGTVNIQVNSRKDPGYTKEITLTVVKPVEALKNSLAKEYQDRFGKNISEYDETGYLQFPEPYNGSWLENVVPSLLAQQLWNTSVYDDIAIAFYNDVKWHEAQGISYNEAAKLKYAWIKVGETRGKRNLTNREMLYTPSESMKIYFSRHSIWDDYLTYVPRINEIVGEELGDRNFAREYQQFVYSNLFGTGIGIYNHSPEEYYSKIIEFFSHKNMWEELAVKDMPKGYLRKLQNNVIRYVPKVCSDPNYAKELVDDWFAPNRDSKEICREFIRNAKEYGLWTEEAQRNYNNLLGRETAETESSIIEQILQGVIREAQRITY